MPPVDVTLSPVEQMCLVQSWTAKSFGWAAHVGTRYAPISGHRSPPNYQPIGQDRNT